MTTSLIAPATFFKNLRIVENDAYVPRTDPRIPEIRLREKLRAGIPVENVCLVGPYSGSAQRLGRGGRLLEPTWAWTDRWKPFNTASPDWWYMYTYEGPPVRAVIQSYESHPDPSPVDAACGAMVVTDGRITSLTIPKWLGPIAPSLRSRYGVAVNVNREGTPDREPVECDPLVIRQVFTADEAAELREIHERNRGNFEIRDGKSTSGCPEVGKVVDLMRRGRDHFRLGLNQTIQDLESYPEGVGHDWHKDRGEPPDYSYYWKVIFHVLLSEPGVDFTGGIFETHHGPVEAAVGDCIAYTSGTPYRITPIEAGRRCFLAAYGTWDGWD